MTLKLKPNPTFKAKVGIPVHGGGSEEVEFTFKHRTRAEMVEWGKVEEGAEERSETDVVMDCVTAWELEDAYNRDNVELLLQNYMGAGRAILDKYILELAQARLGN